MANARTGKTALCPWRHAPRVNAHDHLVFGRVQVLASGQSDDVDHRWPLSFSDVALIVDARTVATTQTGADGSFMLLVHKAKKTKSSMIHKRQRQQAEIRVLKDTARLCGQVNVTRPSSIQWWGEEDEATIWEEDILIDPHDTLSSCKDTKQVAWTAQLVLHTSSEQARGPSAGGLGVCIDLLQSFVGSPDAFPFDKASRSFRLVLVSVIFMTLVLVTWRRRRTKALQTAEINICEDNVSMSSDVGDNEA